MLDVQREGRTETGKGLAKDQQPRAMWADILRRDDNGHGFKFIGSDSALVLQVKLISALLVQHLT